MLFRYDITNILLRVVNWGGEHENHWKNWVHCGGFRKTELLSDMAIWYFYETEYG